MLRMWTWAFACAWQVTKLCMCLIMPGLLFWLLLPLHLMLNLVSVIWFAARGQGGVIFRAKRDALKGLRRAWAKRQWIQRDRVASIREIWRALDNRLIRA